MILHTLIKSGCSVGKAALYSIALVVLGCAPTPTDPSPITTASPGADGDRPSVVVTSYLLCDLTKQIAATTIHLTCLMEPGQDPHVYEPTPSDRQALEEADLVLYGGYEYEPDLIKMIEALQTPVPKVAVYEVAVPAPLMGEAHDHAHPEGEAHSENSDHPEEAEHSAEATEPDPHIWHDAQNGVQIVVVLRDELRQLVPAEADHYSQKATTLTEELQAIDRWIPTQVATIPSSARKLVTTHAAFNYFANAYGLTVEGALSGLSTDTAPSASQITELVEKVKASGVPAIFAESTTNPKLIETVAREARVQVPAQPLFIEGPGGNDTAAPTYQQMLITNTCTVVNGLGGTCDPESMANP